MTTLTRTTAPRRAGQMALRAACAGLRVFFRHAPGGSGKQWVWDRVVRPHLLSRSLPIEARTRFGARIAGGFPDAAHGVLYFFGTWRPGTTALFQQALRPGDVAIDVGARVGLHSLLAAGLVGPGGRVHAIEPSPSVFARLRRNLQANAAFQVIPHNLAAMGAVARVPIYLHDQPGPTGSQPAMLEAMVHGRPLPEIVPAEDLMAARLIHIDVAGAEWQVVQGLAPWLGHLRAEVEILVVTRRAALEKAGGSIAGLLALFAAEGFAAHEVHQGTGAGLCRGEAPPPPTPFAEDGFEGGTLLFRRPLAA